MTMLERRANVHFCCKCGKGMGYSGESMVYLYKVHKEINQYWTRDGRKIESVKTLPKVKRAYNLCEDCANGFSELLDIFLELEEPQCP